ncbi:MAG: hypothetical protein AAGU12_15035 [Clostridiales bacterium]
MDTEVIATTAIKERLAFCDGLQSYINERDKEPLWDGHIYVFPKGANSKEKLIGRVPVQVKGKKKVVSKKTTNLSYSVEVIALQKYLQDGGIIYFVVTFEENRAKTIFYKTLLPFDLQRAIANAGNKKQRKINLQRLPEEDDSIRQLFISFLQDKKRQATQIVWSEEQAAMALKDGGSLKFHILPKTQPKNYYDVMKEATTQDFYVYIETKDGVEFPFAKIENRVSAAAVMKMDMPVYVNGEKFYDNISCGYENGRAYLYIGQVLKLPFAAAGETVQKHNFKFSLKGTLNSRIADSNFIIALSEYKCVRLGTDSTDVIFNINVDNPKDILNLKGINDALKKSKAALEYFGVHTDLDMSNLSTEDNHSIDALIRAASGEPLKFEEKGLPRLFYYNKRIGNLVIRILAKQEENSDAYRLSNAFSDKAHGLYEFKKEDGEKVIIDPWSLFLYMKADDFLCSNVNYATILNSIKAMDSRGKEIEIRDPVTEKSISVNSMLLEVINAYDSQVKKSDELLRFALDIAEIIESNTAVTIINKYQVIRRMRNLTSDEIADLVALRRKHCDDKLIRCAISILLSEEDEAKRQLNELSEEEKKGITDYPIYRLLSRAGCFAFAGGCEA